MTDREPARYLPFLWPSERLMPGRLTNGLRADAFGNGRDDALHVQIDRRRNEYMQQKRSSTFGRSLAAREACTADRSAHAEVLAWLARTLSSEHPDRFSQAELERASLAELVDALQEDLVIMQRGGLDEEARAAYLHVSFPSGWRPERMLGRTFSEIHDKVPHEDGFAGANARTRYAAKLYDATRVRFVWTVSPDGALDRHPDATAGRSWSTAREAHVRVERQTIAPIDAAISVFLIRVYVYPVSELSAAERAALLSALDAMSAELRSYKGLARHEQEIRALVQGTR
jgi:hypothetical protein